MRQRVSRIAAVFVSFLALGALVAAQSSETSPKAKAVSTSVGETDRADVRTSLC